MNKKSQMEAFGLAIIVVLIILGLFIVISLRNNTVPTDIRREYIFEQLPTNFVTSMADVTVEECYSSKETLERVIRYCALGERKTCSGIDACTLAKKTILKLLNNTLIKQNYAFHFFTENLDYSGAENIDINNRNCTLNTPKGKRGFVYIPLYGIQDSVVLNLDICKK